MIMNAGERKALSSDRTILVPGPPQELQVIQDIYNLFLDQICSLNEIARILNNRQIPNSSGNVWKPVAIREILTNPKYIGSAVFGRTARKLNSRTVKRPRADWVVRDGAFDPVVSAERFHEAQHRLRENARAYTEQELLDSLTAIWCKKGSLNAGLVDDDRFSACANTYLKHFGGLVPAYRKIGYVGRFQRGRAPQFRKSVVARIAEEIARQGGIVAHDRDYSQVCVNEELEVAVVAGCVDTACGKNQWHVTRLALEKPDILVVLRIDDRTAEIKEYVLVPLLILPNESWLTITKTRLEKIAVYRSPTLEPLFALCERRELGKST